MDTDTSEEVIEGSRTATTPLTAPSSAEAITQIMQPVIQPGDLFEVSKVLARSIKQAFDRKSEHFFTKKQNPEWDHQPLLAIDEEAFPTFDFQDTQADARVVLENFCDVAETAYPRHSSHTAERCMELDTSRVVLSMVSPLDDEQRMAGGATAGGPQFYEDYSFFIQVYIIITRDCRATSGLPRQAQTIPFPRNGPGRLRKT